MKKTLMLVSILGLVACTKNNSNDRSQDLVKPLGDDQVILEYKGGKITAKDVKDEMKPQFERAREQILNSYVKAAEDILAQRVADRLKTETTTVTETELENYMRANKIPKTDSEKIRTFLVAEKARIQKQIDKMQVFKELDVKNKLGAARYDVKATSDMPTQGPTTATVTIQVFCDFGNPICNRSRLTMGEIKNEFGDKVRWVYRHFPVASNPLGEESSLVAICAQQQDRFWAVYDRFFDQQAGMTKENLTKVAVSAGVDESKLNDCLQSQEPKNFLAKEIKDAEALGLTQTPAYFVNGTKVNDIDTLKSTVTTLVTQ
ncbi:DsbA family protein [Bdellovibrio sp. HCB337]|uniref:DsbA family protein n=1 Tax=Bdellovibrio sp. HCB337 TaxID=3394358 RepID=UPI0039A4CD52